jgi:hypothetical protein
MSECNKSWSDLQRQSKLEQNFQNKLMVEDLKIECGPLESQEVQVYYMQCMKWNLGGSIFLLE